MANAYAKALSPLLFPVALERYHFGSLCRFPADRIVQSLCTISLKSFACRMGCVAHLEECYAKKCNSLFVATLGVIFALALT